MKFQYRIVTRTHPSGKVYYLCQYKAKSESIWEGVNYYEYKTKDLAIEAIKVDSEMYNYSDTYEDIEL